MIIQNQNAEYGGIIISDTVARTFERRVVRIRVLAETVVAAITSTANDNPVAGINWYAGKTLPVGHEIHGNIATLQLTSGTVQAYYSA